MRSGKVYVDDRLAGTVIETDEGSYTFSYDSDYLQYEKALSVSLTLPLREEAYTSNILFPFFDGLIPEGWLLDLSITNWKLNAKDRMGLLLACCEDCIGNVSIRAENHDS